MAEIPYLPFLGFQQPGAILTDPFYNQNQDVSVYDLIARGYNPGYRGAFFDTLPNQTNPATFGTPVAPLSGFYPGEDYSYLAPAAAAAASQAQAQQYQNAIKTGAGAAKELATNWSKIGTPSAIPGLAPAEAAAQGGAGGVAAGIDEAVNAGLGAEPSLWGNALSGISDAFSAATPFLPFVGAGIGGALQLAQGNYAGGAGTLGGTALGAALGSIIPGLGTALGAGLGALGGSFLGDLLGNDQPSKAWTTYGSRLGQTLSTEQGAEQSLSNALAGAGSQDDIYKALVNFRGQVGSRVPGYGGTSGLVPGDMPGNYYFQGDQLFGSGTPEQYNASTGNLFTSDQLFGNLGSNLANAIPDLPGATGAKHEGGVSYDPNDIVNQLRQQLLGTTQALTAKQFQGPSQSLATALTNAQSPEELQQALTSFYGGIGGGYGSNAAAVSTFGGSPDSGMLSSALPDLPGLSNQDAIGGLRSELGTAYGGIVNKTNPFTGRGGLPAPAGATQGAVGAGVRIGTGGQRTDALGNAIANADTFLGG